MTSTTISTTATKLPSVSVFTKPNFVSWPPATEAIRQTAQLTVLEALTNPAVDKPERSPLVQITLVPVRDVVGIDYINRSGKMAVQLDVEDEGLTLKEALLPPRTYLPNNKILKPQRIALDEGYLHSLLSNWEGKDSISKMMIAANAMSLQASIPFTVRFGEGRAKNLGRDPAQALRKLRTDLGTLTALGPTMVTVELDKNGVLHLHGVVATNAVWTDVKKILQKIGGESSSQAFKNMSQVKIERPRSLCGWAAYLTKNLINEPISDRDDFIYISQSATQLGKGRLPVLKALALEKLGVVSDWRGKAGVYSKPSVSMLSSFVSGMTRH